MARSLSQLLLLLVATAMISTPVVVYADGDYNVAIGFDGNGCTGGQIDEMQVFSHDLIDETGYEAGVANDWQYVDEADDGSDGGGRRELLSYPELFGQQQDHRELSQSKNCKCSMLCKRIGGKYCNCCSCCGNRRRLRAKSVHGLQNAVDYIKKRGLEKIAELKAAEAEKHRALELEELESVEEEGIEELEELEDNGNGWWNCVDVESIEVVLEDAEETPCCSIDHKNCIEEFNWCNHPDRCDTNCGSDYVWLEDGVRTDCIARWTGGCEDDDDCCDGLYCDTSNQWWKSCQLPAQV